MTQARRILVAALPAAALAMLAVTLLPAEVWPHAAVDATYSGFDSNLVYGSGGAAGSVQVGRDAVMMTSGAHSFAALNLVTTPMARLAGQVDIVIDKAGDTADPFRIGLWDPEGGAGYFVHFGQAPNDYVTVEAITDGSTDRTLLDGTVMSSTYWGKYELGSTYRIAFALDRSAGTLRFQITDLAGATTQSTGVDATSFPALFESGRLSLTASSEGAATPADVRLSGWRLTLPHQRFWAVRIDDLIANVILVLLGLVGAIVLVAWPAVAYVERGPRPLPRLPHLSGRLWAGAAVAAVVYLAGNALLFPLGGHPFDMGVEKLYAYVTHTYGLSDLFYLPNTVSLARIWDGVPYVESAFPYPPPVAYPFAAIGFVNSALFAGGGAFPVDSRSVQYLIESINVAFGLVDSALIYATLRRLGVTPRWAVAGAVLFMFNPAVWFSMSVWGQTHVISVCFVLLAILFVQLELPAGAWLALAAACLTRPQMLVFGAVLAAVLLRRFDWRQNLAGASLAIVAAFLVMLPLTLQTSPSLPVDVLLNNFHVQEGGAGAALVPVSQDAYSIWPLVTYLLEGVTGAARAYTPSSDALVGTLTYQRAGQLLTAVMLIAVLAAVAVRRRVALQRGDYIPLVAVAIVSFLMLLTGTVATHFILALPLLILCRRWMSNAGYLYAITAWTVTTFVPMYGDMGRFMSAQDYPALAASRNSVTQLFVNLFTYDRFITVAVLANVCVLVWVAVTAFRRERAPAEETLQPDRALSGLG
jgi:hypothetical protein